MREKLNHLPRAGPLLAMCLCAMLLAVAPAAAVQTTVYETTWGGNPWDEWDLEFGLPVNPSAPGPGNLGPGINDLLDYNYTTWTRIEDFGVVPNDQVWLDLDGAALVKAIYTSNNLYLGYSVNEVTGSPITYPVGSGGGNLDTVGETASFDLDLCDEFLWVIGGIQPVKYSLQALNSGTDYMVSYRIHGIYTDPKDHTQGSYIPSDPTYVIGFEDGTDADFQDFVAQVSKVVPVPEPLTMLGMFLGLGSVGAYIRRRRMA